MKDVFDAEKIKALEALGWHVEISDDSIAIHKYFKNGNPRKGAEAGILFHEFSHSIFVGDDLEHEEFVKSTRPWYVYGPDLASARTFTHLGKALELFLSLAEKHASKNRYPNMDP